MHRREEIMPGVFLTSVQTDKFKTSALSVSLVRPLRRETASLNALLPAVLRMGTERYPDMESYSDRLNELYGARIEPYVRKKGEAHLIGFVCDFADDRFAPLGTDILENTASLCIDTILRPALKDGAFKSEYVEGEKRNLSDRIEAQINDKRTYASRRIIELMCDGENFGADPLGSVSDVQGITPEGLFSHWKDILRTSFIQIFYCGAFGFDRVKNALLSGLSGLERGRFEPISTEVMEKAGEVRGFDEELDITQGKLSLGFRTGGSVMDESYPAYAVFNTIFGASTTSKLFLNVRERLSLCYYASSIIEKFKGVMVVSSGIEFENYQKALDEILSQLEDCRNGAIEPWEIDSAKSYLISGLKSSMDSVYQMEEFYLGQSSAGLDYGPEELARRISSVTREQIIECAGRVTLDSIYFLKGKGA